MELKYVILNRIQIITILTTIQSCVSSDSIIFHLFSSNYIKIDSNTVCDCGLNNKAFKFKTQFKKQSIS